MPYAFIAKRAYSVLVEKQRATGLVLTPWQSLPQSSKDSFIAMIQAVEDDLKTVH